MTDIFRIFSAIISLLLFLASLAVMVFAATIPNTIMLLTSLLLSVVFGYFVYIDYVKFFVNKSAK
jgi:hypothetical protein